MESVKRFVYGPTPQERVKEWQSQIRKESRMLDREIRGMNAAQSKAKGQLKQLASKGEKGNARILAREFVRSRKQIQRLHTSQAQLNSISMQLNHQLGALAHSSDAEPYSDTEDIWTPREVDGDHEAV